MAMTYEEKKARAERRTRLENEHNDLAAKCTKLKFKLKECSDDLSEKSIDILRKQLIAMDKYRYILEQRIREKLY